MSEANKAPESKDNQEVDQETKKKKVVEKLQAMGMMLGGKEKTAGEKKTSTGNRVNFANAIVLVIVAVSGWLWFSSEKQNSVQTVASSNTTNQYNAGHAYAPVWNPYGNNSMGAYPWANSKANRNTEKNTASKNTSGPGNNATSRNNYPYYNGSYQGNHARNNNHQNTQANNPNNMYGYNPYYNPYAYNHRPGTTRNSQQHSQANEQANNQNSQRQNRQATPYYGYPPVYGYMPQPYSQYQPQYPQPNQQQYQPSNSYYRR